MSGGTFYDQWHRIAHLRVGLRPGISIRLHEYNQEPWYVLHEAGHGGFFRLRPEFHDLVAGLSPEQTLDESWRSAIERNPDTAPGQKEFFDLLTGLYAANLLHVEGGVDEMRLLDRGRRKHQKPLPARISELLFLRIPLWDPEPFLRRSERVIRFIYGPVGIALFVAMLAWGGLEFILAGPRIWSQAQTILQPNNLVALYIAIFATHFLHELSHAALCKFFGGTVRTMGVMLLMFTPLPYADVSAAWAFRDRWHRALVGAAGMYADAFACALATIVWAWTPIGALNEMAYNLMFVTAVYTLVFNVNPLMRFDGYYILSDLIDAPNLHQQSRTAFNTVFRRVFLRETRPDDGGITAERRAVLVAFFLASLVYRTFVMVGIILFVADQYFGLGLIVAAALSFTSVVQPIARLLSPLRSPLFMARHVTKIRLSFGAVAALLAVFLFVPLPYSRQIDGVIEAVRDTPIHTRTGGKVAAVHVAPGQAVKAGDLLIELENAELVWEREGVLAQIARAQAQEALTLSRGGIELDTVQERLTMLDGMRRHLDTQLAALQIHAPHDGIWVGEDPGQRLGAWVGRGHLFGKVMDEGAQLFLGVVRQEAARDLGGVAATSVSVRVEGARGVERAVSVVSVVPYSQRDLPSAALGAQGAGDMAVSARDPEGRETVEQFFLLKAWLGGGARAAEGAPQSGRTAWIRIALPPRPLGGRLMLAVQQFFQRRYQV